MSASVAGRASITARRIQSLLLGWSGVTGQRLSGHRGETAILMYHRVLRDDESADGVEPGMFVRASTFERQIQWLQESFRLTTLGELLDRPIAADAPPAAVLTFDDGWRDNLTVAWPILRRHSVRATIFVVRDWSQRGSSHEGQFLTPDEIRGLADAGIEFGAHTVTHPRLSALPDADVEAEMRQSKRAVEQWTDKACELFAYPYGDHHTGTAEIARSIFRMSVRVGGGWWNSACDSARVPRVGIHEDVTDRRETFRARLAGLF